MNARSKSHPLAAEFLLDYATGAAPEPVAVLVASHIALNPASQAATGQLETVGGAMLADVEPASVSDDALAKTLARLGEQESASPAPHDDRLPAPLRAYLRGDIEQLDWRRRGWGLREAVLPCGDERHQLSLLRIRPGGSIPRHTHRGTELTLVLEGGFSDQNGHYERGDVCFADETVDHRPVADPGRECLCLAVAAGPVRFKGWLGLVLNPFLRG